MACFIITDPNGNPSGGAGPVPAVPLDRSSASAASTPKRHSAGRRSADGGGLWEVTLNQFVATTISVCAIDEHFTQPFSIKSRIEMLQKNRRKCKA
ncbi:conserved hypothetical protein [Culex quinquefasciatus]|uniref:Uncharacterized protein n=1 Tax=Culex quinquefasciatus TaxID=7176 RepID=B0WNW3_CULQU|nr:conserved hypothetical protein [Culex quinquefasciatus]|eukprot:XP_001850397.1 conserved hypothetical protein [Culex quinquefasciatus]